MLVLVEAVNRTGTLSKAGFAHISGSLSLLWAALLNCLHQHHCSESPWFSSYVSTCIREDSFQEETIPSSSKQGNAYLCACFGLRQAIWRLALWVEILTQVPCISSFPS